MQVAAENGPQSRYKSNKVPMYVGFGFHNIPTSPFGTFVIPCAVSLKLDRARGYVHKTVPRGTHNMCVI